jgi:hypothetical protein
MTSYLKEVATVVSIAGELFSDYGLMSGASVDAFAFQGVVRLSFRLNITPHQSTALYVEFREYLDDHHIEIPSKTFIDFLGTVI